MILGMITKWFWYTNEGMNLANSCKRTEIVNPPKTKQVLIGPILVLGKITDIRDRFHLRADHEGPDGEQRYSSNLSLTSALDRGGWSMSRPDRFTYGEDPVPIMWATGWATGSVWTDVKNITLTGFRSPNGPDRSESLYQLSYPGPILEIINNNNYNSNSLSLC
jgi:hypothetical protein